MALRLLSKSNHDDEFNYRLEKYGITPEELFSVIQSAVNALAGYNRNAPNNANGSEIHNRIYESLATCFETWNNDSAYHEIISQDGRLMIGHRTVADINDPFIKLEKNSQKAKFLTTNNAQESLFSINENTLKDHELLVVLTERNKEVVNVRFGITKLVDNDRQIIWDALSASRPLKKESIKTEFGDEESAQAKPLIKPKN